MDNHISLSPEGEEDLKVNTKTSIPLVSKSIFNWFLFGTSLIISVVLLIMFFFAANSVKNGGLDIMSIQSVGGKTLEEAYYYGLGYIYEGYCIAIRAMGIFFSSVLFLFGVSRLKNVK